MSIVGRRRIALGWVVAVVAIAGCCPGDCIKPAPCAPPPPKPVEVKKVEPVVTPPPPAVVVPAPKQ